MTSDRELEGRPRQEPIFVANTSNHRVDLESQIGERSVDGYDVMATDGNVGSVEEHSGDHLVVDTGFRIVEEKRVVCAGAVAAVDHADEKVYVCMTKDEVESLPTCGVARPRIEGVSPDGGSRTVGEAGVIDSFRRPRGAEWQQQPELSTD
jgi:hypothetical protein